MAKGEKRVRVRITSGVIFDGKDLLPGETHVLPDWFAQSVIQSNRGVDADAAEDDDEERAEGEQPDKAAAKAAPATSQPARSRA